jgi:hypothetical protein
MVQMFFFTSNKPNAFMTLIHLEASFWLFQASSNSPPCFEVQTTLHASQSMISCLLPLKSSLHDLDMCHLVQRPTPSSPSCARSLDQLLTCNDSPTPTLTFVKPARVYLAVHVHDVHCTWLCPASHGLSAQASRLTITTSPLSLVDRFPNWNTIEFENQI